jgi:hypothetical protein
MAKKISEYTIKELREICQACHLTLEKKKEDNKVGIFSLNFSIYFTRLFLYMGATPNQITFLGVAVFFVGIFLLTLNNYILGIVGSLIIFFSIVLDGCDGEVARFRKFIGKPIKGNIGGLYVEPVSHDIQYGFAFLILAHGLAAHGFPDYYYILGSLAGITKLLFRLLQSRFCLILGVSNVSREESIDMHKSLKKKSIFIKLIYRFNKTFFNNSGVFIIIFIGAIFNRLDLSLWFFGLGYSFLWLALFGKQLYQISKLKQI